MEDERVKTEERTTEPTMSGKRKRSVRGIGLQGKMIGKPEELIPFAWRNPLEVGEIKKLSKTLRTILQQEQSRKINS